MKEQSCLVVENNGELHTPSPDPIPISIFRNDNLSPLESITKYLKEVRRLNYRAIGILLNRDERTVWGEYQSSLQKMPELLSSQDSHYSMPLSIISDRTLSVLESITYFLKETYNLRHCEIACLLNRDDRTIWTVYNRAKRKISLVEHAKQI